MFGRSWRARGAIGSYRAKPPRGRSRVAWRVPVCSLTCWRPSMPIICRCIGRARSTLGRVWRWSARRWRTGWVALAPCCVRWSRYWRRRRSGPISCTPPTRLCRCWRRGAAPPGPAGCGYTCVMTVPLVMACHRRRCSATPPIARDNGRKSTFGGSGASCRRMAMPATLSSTATRSSRSPAGPTPGASSMTCTSTRAPSSRGRRSNASAPSMTSRRASAGTARPSARRRVRPAPDPCLRSCNAGSTRACAVCRGDPGLPPPSATPAPAGASSVATVTTADWRSTTAPPNVRCVASPWAARTGC